MKLPGGQIKWRLSAVALALCTLLCSSCGLFNDAPVISSVQSQREWVDLSDCTEIECVASDPDGDELTYQWTTNGGNISGQGPIITWTAPDNPGTYTIGVKVTDGRGDEVTSQTTMDVRINHPPVIDSLAAEQAALGEGESTSIECFASDPDGDELTYLWEATGGDISGQGSVVTWIAPGTCSTYSVIVTVADGRGGEASADLSIRVSKPGSG